jgi:hypothetical protein
MTGRSTEPPHSPPLPGPGAGDGVPLEEGANAAPPAPSEPTPTSRSSPIIVRQRSNLTRRSLEEHSAELERTRGAANPVNDPYAETNAPPPKAPTHTVGTASESAQRAVQSFTSALDGLEAVSVVSLDEGNQIGDGAVMVVDPDHVSFHVDDRGMPLEPDLERWTVHEMLATRHRRLEDEARTVRDRSQSLQSMGVGSPAHHYLQAISVAPGSPGGLSRQDSMKSFENTSFFDQSGRHYPRDVLKIARQMRGLNEEEFLMLADLTQKRAWRNVYSLLEYRGTSWYLPTLRPVEAGEPTCGISYERTAGVIVSAAGWRMELPVVGYVARIVLLAALWVFLWSIMPSHLVELNGFVFDPVLAVLFAAIVGGIVSRLLRIPPLVCVLWMGIFWNNVPSVGYFTSGINPYVFKAATTLGLDVILIRAGLYIKPEELKPILLLFAGFALLPAIAELVSHSFMASALFDYPDYTWAFTQGAMAAAVSPAVVVPAVLTLKVDGFCVTRGPGMLMMPAAPAEMVVAIWNINFMSQLAIDTGEIPLWLNILGGPLQIIGGILLGAMLGALHFLGLKMFLAEAQKLPHRNYTVEHMNRVAWLNSSMLVIVGAATLALTKKLHVAGGGAVAVTVMAMVTGALHRRRGDTVYFAEQFKQLCIMTADLWDVFMMPVLFGLVGASINLSEVFTADFFPPMLACLAVGLTCRMIVAALVTIREDYDLGERVVMAVGWCGKASVQAALGRVVLDRANDYFDDIASSSGEQAAVDAVRFGKRIANAAVVCIIISAPLASFVLVRLGPRFFRHELNASGAH